MAQATFWFEFASTYSHIAAQRVEELAKERGVALAWRPFLLGPIFQAKGWTTSPFLIDPVKGAYMWRDMQRLSARMGLPLVKPPVFPARSMTAARMAIQIQDGPEMAAFVRAIYLAEYVEGLDIAETAVLLGVAKAVGLDGEELMAGAAGDGVKAKLKAQNDEAVALGLFGAPSITTRGEIFWGNDRIEEALDWAQEPWA
jgi:2-hydroxychromene-2-carboxylate isomerase